MSKFGYPLILLGFLLARWDIFNADRDQAFSDTSSYARVADYGVGNQLFWIGERPFTLPLIYQALGLKATDPLDLKPMHHVTEFQLSLSVVAWIALAGTVAWTIRGRWDRLAAFGLILAFGTSLGVAQWDRILLSESVSTSLFVAMIGVSILGVQLWRHPAGGLAGRWNILFVVGTSLLVVLFAFTRDANAYLVLAGSILLAAGATILAVQTRPAAPIAAVLAIVMAGTFYLQDRSSSLGRRWLGPFLNVFSARILPVDRFVDFFSDRGLPRDAITREMYLGRAVFLSELAHGQEGNRVLEWIEQSGKSTYFQFLASRPVQSLGKPILRAGSMVNVDSSEYRLRVRADPAWAVLISRLMFPTRIEFLVGFALAACAVPLKSKNRNRFAPLWSIAFALIVLSYPLAIVIWHADTIELERHSYQLALQLRLAAWLLLIGAMPSVSELAAKMVRRPVAVLT